MTPLDLTPLTRALAALQRGLLRWQATPEDEELRDACIQRFEFTFELCWKMLKRRLEMDAPNAAEIAAVLPAFALDASALLRALEQRAVDPENGA